MFKKRKKYKNIDIQNVTEKEKDEKKVFTSILKYIHPAFVVRPVSVWEMINCVTVADMLDLTKDKCRDETAFLRTFSTGIIFAGYSSNGFAKPTLSDTIHFLLDMTEYKKYPPS